MTAADRIRSEHDRQNDLCAELLRLENKNRVLLEENEALTELVRLLLRPAIDRMSDAQALETREALRRLIGRTH